MNSSTGDERHSPHLTGFKNYRTNFKALNAPSHHKVRPPYSSKSTYCHVHNPITPHAAHPRCQDSGFKVLGLFKVVKFFPYFAQYPSIFFGGDMALERQQFAARNCHFAL